MPPHVALGCGDLPGRHRCAVRDFADNANDAAGKQRVVEILV